MLIFSNTLINNFFPVPRLFLSHEVKETLYTLKNKGYWASFHYPELNPRQSDVINLNFHISRILHSLSYDDHIIRHILTNIVPMCAPILSYDMSTLTL